MSWNYSFSCSDLGGVGVVRGAEKLMSSIFHLLQCVQQADGPGQLIRAGLMSKELFI